MAEPDVHIAALTENQQLALQQFTSVTHQELSSAIALLERCQWNVQIAIARFFDGEPADPVPEASAPPPRPTTRQETLINGSSHINPRNGPGRQLEPAPRVVPQPNQDAARPHFLLSVLWTPFSIMQGFLAKSFGLIGYLFPFIPRLYGRLWRGNASQQDQRRIGRARRTLSPRDTAGRFRREFEEEYGTGELQSVPFLEDGYAQAHDKAKRELKFLLVILLSLEHDETPNFVREILLSDQVKAFLNRAKNDLLIWGGNVRDPEAYQVSSALNCTKFPFVALIAHTPSVSPTAMSVLARISGTTSLPSFVGELQKAMSEHSEALARARAARAEQQATRNLRSEQNSAYERSLAQDRERARLRREAEEARASAERLEREKAENRTRRLQSEATWRKWRAQSLKPEPGPETKDVIRMIIRLLSGERAARRFAPDAELDELYAFVECYEYLRRGDLSEKLYDKPEDYAHEYKFRLASPLPRQVFAPQEGQKIRDSIGRSGNLIVERLEAEEGSDEDS